MHHWQVTRYVRAATPRIRRGLVHGPELPVLYRPPFCERRPEAPPFRRIKRTPQPPTVRRCFWIDLEEGSFWHTTATFCDIVIHRFKPLAGPLGSIVKLSRCAVATDTQNYRLCSRSSAPFVETSVTLFYCYTTPITTTSLGNFPDDTSYAAPETARPTRPASFPLCETTGSGLASQYLCPGIQTR